MLLEYENLLAMFAPKSSVVGILVFPSHNSRAVRITHIKCAFIDIPYGSRDPKRDNSEPTTHVA